MNGAAFVQGHFARDEAAKGNNFVDLTGKRAMGFYDDSDLPFYYFIASNFATSDRWFSPVATRTQPNRIYWMAATSQGHIFAPRFSASCENNFPVYGRAQHYLENLRSFGKYLFQLFLVLAHAPKPTWFR